MGVFLLKKMAQWSGRGLTKIIFNLYMIKNKYISKTKQFVFGKMPQIQFEFGRNLKNPIFFSFFVEPGKQ